MNDVPMKKCTGPCEKEYPATTEYFYHKKLGKYDLTSKCKKCANIKDKPSNNIPEGYKLCKGPCKQIYPATIEFFYKTKTNKHGLATNCKECRKKQQKEYQNKPEIKKHIHAIAKDHRSHPEVKENNRIYQEKYRNRPDLQEHKSTYHKEYRARPEVQEHNKEYHKEHYSRPEIKEQFANRRRMRHARKRSVKGTHTHAQIRDQLKRQKHKCYYCQARFKKTKGKYLYHIEHTFPLSRVAGTDIPANSIDYLVISCPTCNLSKGDKFPWEWAQGGRLL